MPNRATLISLVALAVILWVGLVAFMNHVPPSFLNQMAFLLIWGFAIACTTIPLAYVVNGRFQSFRKARDLSLAVRRGSLTGILALVLMALRFLRLLSLLSGILLVALALAIEVSLTLRRR